MSLKIRPHKSMLDISPYIGGKAHIDGVVDAVKLSSNENPHGSSERAKEAFAKSIYNLHRYPEGGHLGLRKAIGEVHELDADRVICGVGSDEILSLLCHAYASVGDNVIFSEHGFLLYRIVTLAVGATPREAPEKNRTLDVDAILALCDDKTKLVFIANPNNPTGTMVPLSELERLARALPPQTLLVIDEAYAEYVGDGPQALSLAMRYDNVFVTRTFSKIYGLGGVRVGWGYGASEVIDVLKRIRPPFNLSMMQQKVAEAAVYDQEWVVKCRSDNNRLREWLSQALRDVGVPSDPSFGNFILARFSTQQEAEACDAHLQSQGLIVRKTTAYKLPECLRITIGEESSCRRVAHAIGQFKSTT